MRGAIKMNKYLVAEISKSNKDRIKLKRALYGLKMDELILNSINAYEGETKISINCKDKTYPIVNVELPIHKGVENL